MSAHWVPHERRRGRTLALSAATVLAALAAWSWLSYGNVIERLFLPTPDEVARTLVQMVLSGELRDHTLASLGIVFSGWTLAAAAAVPLGLMAGTSPTFSSLFAPLASFARYLPVSALIPLIILYVGIGDSSRVTVIFVGTFFQMAVMIADAAGNVASNLVEGARTLGARGLAVAGFVVLPGAAPGIADALRVNLGAAWTYVVVAEIVAAERGLGYMILDAMRGLFVAKIFVGLLVIGALGFACDRVFEGLHRRCLPWSEKAR